MKRVIELPFYRVRQKLSLFPPISVEETLIKELKKLKRNLRGKRVAIPVGSRAIPKYREIVKICVEKIKALGGVPYLIPAMGSHAGGTAEAQKEFLKKAGFTKRSVGCEIVSTDDTVEREGFVFDKFAYKCDCIFLINRIRPHTAFTGEFGSGLMKLATVGLGKREGAFRAHRVGLKNYIRKAFLYLLHNKKILGGIGIVERHDGNTVALKFIPPARIPEGEKRLFKIAKDCLIKLPFYPLDILIVRSIGKNISGTGIDTNVVGMERREGKRKKVKVIVALNLSPDSQGNGYGVGFADVITEKIITNINWEVTYTNALSTGCIEAIKLPFIMPNDRTAINFAQRFLRSQKTPSVIIAENTGDLEFLLMNERALKKAESKVEVIEEKITLSFDTFENLEVMIRP